MPGTSTTPPPIPSNPTRTPTPRPRARTRIMVIERRLSVQGLRKLRRAHLAVSTESWQRGIPPESGVFRCQQQKLGRENFKAKCGYCYSRWFASNTFTRMFAFKRGQEQIHAMPSDRRPEFFKGAQLK